MNYHEVKSIVQKVKMFTRNSNLPEPMLDFYARSCILQFEQPSDFIEQEELQKIAKTKPIDSANLPLCSISDLNLDEQRCRSTLSFLLEMSAGITPLLSLQSEKINAMMRDDRIPTEIFKQAAAGNICEIEQFAAEEQIDTGVFFFLLRSTARILLKPELDLFANGKNLTAWHEGRCPVCGSLPHFSYLSKNHGKRMLSCSFCNHTWSIERICCPFCGNLEKESLRIVTLEQEPGIRADICKKCKQYIKIMDLREVESSGFSALDDLGTLHVDIRLQEEGFVRPVPVPI
jgi:hypothetical protein